MRQSADKFLEDMEDHELLDVILPGILEHSDYTIHGDYKHRLREKLDAIEAKNDGRLTPELALKVIRWKSSLVAAMNAYDPWPLWLMSLLKGLHMGHYKLSGGQVRDPPWAKDRDIVGIFDKLREMGFKKTDIYQKLAEHLNVIGHSEMAENPNATKGAETVRQHIMRMKGALK